MANDHPFPSSALNKFLNDQTTLKSVAVGIGFDPWDFLVFLSVSLMTNRFQPRSNRSKALQMKDEPSFWRRFNEEKHFRALQYKSNERALTDVLIVVSASEMPQRRSQETTGKCTEHMCLLLTLLPFNWRSDNKQHLCISWPSASQQSNKFTFDSD